MVTTATDPASSEDDAGDGDRVTKICLAGMRAESKGDTDEARDLYQQAWDEAADDYEACVAAHFLARVQPTVDDNLAWNQEALRRADAAARSGDERVGDFYPSLYLNLGYAHELHGAPAEAARWYDRAVECLPSLPDGSYGDMIRGGVEAARARVAAVPDDPTSG